MALPMAHLVLVQCHIQHPVKPILDAPVSPHDRGKALSAERLAYEEVARLQAHFAGRLAARRHLADPLQARPGMHLLQPGNVGAHPGLTHLDTAVISFDASSVAIWPSTRRCSTAQALTRCSGDWPAAWSKERRSVLPSRATTPCSVSLKRCMKRKNTAWNWTGSSRRKTREKASWLGMPWGRRRNWRRNGSLARPNRAMSEQSSPPQSTVHRAMIRISCRSWRALSWRGSSSSWKRRANSSTARLLCKHRALP